MLEALQDIEIASRLVGFDADTNDSIDEKYQKLHCNISPLSHDSEEFRLIEKYLQTTHAPTHTVGFFSCLLFFCSCKCGWMRVPVFMYPHDLNIASFAGMGSWIGRSVFSWKGRRNGQVCSLSCETQEQDASLAWWVIYLCSDDCFLKLLEHIFTFQIWDSVYYRVPVDEFYWYP